MSVRRRDLLKSCLLAPLARLTAASAPLAAATAAHAASGEPYRVPRASLQHARQDAWIEYRPAALRHNARAIHAYTEQRPVLAVIKNDGYGMGLVASAKALEGESVVEGFGVVKLNEALTLREHGVEKPILLMGPAEEDELEAAVRRGITPMLYRADAGAVARIARRLERPVGVEVKIDSGFGRLGIRDDQAVDFYRDLHEQSGVDVLGSMITFSEDRDHDQEQRERFEAVLARVREQGMDPGRPHAASTTPLLRDPEAWYDRVRPGIGLYGVHPQPGKREETGPDLQPAFALRCRVMDVRPLARGESAGYGRAFVAEKDTRVATLPIGHADGWQRDAAGCARVRIGARTYPIVGSVSASHTLVDVGRDSAVGVGDVATLFDWRTGSRAEDVHAACGVSTYDLLMHLSPRIPRHEEAG